MAFTYEYPRPAVTCDVVAFTMRADDLAVLLIRRKRDPFAGHWALPGGFVDRDEALGRAAARELAEETGLTGVKMDQLGAYGDPGRDPRGHTVSVAYVAFLVSEAAVAAGDDAADAQWLPLRSLDAEGVKPFQKSLKDKRPRPRRSVAPAPAREPLAFDHARIVGDAYRRLCRAMQNPLFDASFDFAPPRFTLAELRHVYEIVLGQAIEPRLFYRDFVTRGLVVPAARTTKKRAAGQLYRWNRR
ncbi:MAG: NUDIX hydrolase [Myxococcales bacterium]|nr:NUDIX hydrolase [Myxococcales bacterium]